MSEKCHKIQLALLEGGLRPAQERHIAGCPKCQAYRRTLGLAMSLPPAGGDAASPELAPIRAQHQRCVRRNWFKHLSFGAGWLAAAAAVVVAVGVGLRWQASSPAGGAPLTPGEVAQVDYLLNDQEFELIEFSWDDPETTQRLAELQPVIHEVQWSVTAFDPISEEDWL